MRHRWRPVLRAAMPGVMIGQLYQLIRNERVNAYIRTMCAVFAASMALLGVGPVVYGRSGPYSMTLFDLVFTVAHPIAWGVAYMFAALMLLSVTITGRAVLYALGAPLGSFVLANWAFWVILQAHLHHDSMLTTGAFGLYLGTLGGLLGLAFCPAIIDFPSTTQVTDQRLEDLIAEEKCRLPSKV